LLWLSLTCW